MAIILKIRPWGLLKLLFDFLLSHSLALPLFKRRKKNLNFFLPLLQSGLEKSIEKAIAEGDIAKAEEMSDRLATREVREADNRSLGCSRCDKSG